MYFVTLYNDLLAIFTAQFSLRCGDETFTYRPYCSLTTQRKLASHAIILGMPLLNIYNYNHKVIRNIHNASLHLSDMPI
jgi:hypothetical protein